MKPESDASQRPIVPLEYAGKWIAWNHEQTRIVASASTVQEVIEAARTAGESDPTFEKIPKAGVRVVSLHR